MNSGFFVKKFDVDVYYNYYVFDDIDYFVRFKYVFY